jgi:hypothetical protein
MKHDHRLQEAAASCEHSACWSSEITHTYRTHTHHTEKHHQKLEFACFAIRIKGKKQQ